jgi:hypothetical protein
MISHQDNHQIPSHHLDQGELQVYNKISTSKTKFNGNNRLDRTEREKRGKTFFINVVFLYDIVFVYKDLSFVGILATVAAVDAHLLRCCARLTEMQCEGFRRDIKGSSPLGSPHPPS